MLRRLELYSLAPAAPSDAVGAFEQACRACGRYIPDVVDSATGWNESSAPVQLVWEHAYDSVEAYRRYMAHPFHAAVLDRYLLHDSPERVVSVNSLGAGLVGYECDRAAYRMAAGVRRVVLLRVERAASVGEVDDLMAALGSTRFEAPGPAVSVAAANTLGSAWFDGVTPVGPAPRWTHVWEQGFADPDAFTSYRAAGSTRAGAARDAWQADTGGLVTNVAELWYRLARS